MTDLLGQNSIVDNREVMKQRMKKFIVEQLPVVLASVLIPADRGIKADLRNLGEQDISMLADIIAEYLLNNESWNIATPYGRSESLFMSLYFRSHFDQVRKLLNNLTLIEHSNWYPLALSGLERVVPDLVAALKFRSQLINDPMQIED